MGNLKSMINSASIKKVFILDRNDGVCTSGNKKRIKMIFGSRFVERFERNGDWAFVILERIPTQKRRK